MKTKNVVKRILAMMMVMALMLTTSMTAFAATGSRTYKAASKMTITLNPGQRGNSNTVTIRVSDLPEDAMEKCGACRTFFVSYWCCKQNIIERRK